MGDNSLDFGDGSWEEAGATVRSNLQHHHLVLYGNGKDGLISESEQVRGMIKAIVGIGKLIAWMIGIGLVLFGLWLTSLEVRHRIQIGKDPQASTSQIAVP